MDIETFQKITKDPGTHQRQILDLMQEHPELLVPYAKQIAPHVEFDTRFAKLVGHTNYAQTYSKHLNSDYLIRLLNAGYYSDWMDHYWDRAAGGVTVRMSMAGLCLATHLTRSGALYELVGNTYMGFVDKEDAINAVRRLTHRPKHFTKTLSRNFGNLPMDWWKEIVETTSLRSQEGLAVLIQKLNWKKRAQIYSYIPQNSRKHTALPPETYGPEEEAVARGGFGLIFNRKVGLHHKLKLLSDVGLIEGQLRGGKYLSREGDKIKPKPKVPKYMYCPGSTTLQLKGEVLSDDQLKSLVFMMRAFAPLKVKNFMQGKEHLLGGTDTELGKDLTEWLSKGRIR